MFRSYLNSGVKTLIMNTSSCLLCDLQTQTGGHRLSHPVASHLISTVMLHLNLRWVAQCGVVLVLCIFSHPVLQVCSSAAGLLIITLTVLLSLLWHDISDRHTSICVTSLLQISVNLIQPGWFVRVSARGHELVQFWCGLFIKLSISSLFFLT